MAGVALWGACSFANKSHLQNVRRFARRQASCELIAITECRRPLRAAVARARHRRAKECLIRGRRVVLATVAGTAVLGLMTEAAFAQTRFKAVTTFTVIADMAQERRRRRGRSWNRSPSRAPRSTTTSRRRGDILQAQDADLVLWNGLNLELWFEKFFQQPQRRARASSSPRASSRWASPRGPTAASPTRMPGCRRRRR